MLDEDPQKGDGMVKIESFVIVCYENQCLFILFKVGAVFFLVLEFAGRTRCASEHVAALIF